jgi:glycosyltransferase involved in cell wall biosynthesis
MRYGGGLTHITGLVGGLRSNPHLAAEYVVFHDTLPTGNASGVSVRRRTARGRTLTLFWRQVRFPLMCLRARASCVTLANYPIPMMWRRHVVFEANSKLYDRRSWAFPLLTVARRSPVLRMFPTEAMRLTAGAPRTRSVVVPHGLPAVARASVPVGAEAAAVFVAYPSSHRRQDTALRALARVRVTHPDATLALTVSPESALPEDKDRVERLVALAEHLGVASAVSFLGVVAHGAALELMAGAGLVIFLTEQEAFGLPVAEAAAMGRWVVCSDLAVLREVGGPGCVYVDASDDAAVAEAWARHAAANLSGEAPPPGRPWSWLDSATSFDSALGAPIAREP